MLTPVGMRSVQLMCGLTMALLEGLLGVMLPVCGVVR